MAEQNIPAQAPTRTDEQILPRSAWLQIGKSNLLFDAQKIQNNPIFQISVDILRNTNFFRAFSASPSIPAIYIQQFWNTMKYDEKNGVYCCQVDEQWFNISVDLLRKALDITPVDPAHPFELPPTGDTSESLDVGQSNHLVVLNHHVSRNASFLSIRKSLLRREGKMENEKSIIRSRDLVIVPKGHLFTVKHRSCPKEEHSNTSRNILGGLPVGVESSLVGQVQVSFGFWSKLGDLVSFQMERGIRLMLCTDMMARLRILSSRKSNRYKNLTGVSRAFLCWPLKDKGSWFILLLFRSGRNLRSIIGNTASLSTWALDNLMVGELELGILELEKSGAGVELGFSYRELNALTISFSSANRMNMWGRRARTHFGTMALLRDVETLTCSR
ncbi:hypothetical protein Tco_0988676 [Tanacetum coccineum]|uniref:Uncharacterized protein n=1 Tax=Tanacetum coccineum TaxID=301880 RepID=A0ABQ5ESY1_9ASTR